VKKANPIIPRSIAHAVWASLRSLKSSSQWPAVLARAAAMTPTQGTDENGARAPPHGAPPGGQVCESTWLISVKVARSTKIAEALVKMEAALEALGVERRRAVKPDARKMLYILPMAYGELFGFVSYLFLTRPLSSHPSTEARYYVVEKYYQQL
jgi:hypothetical protein